MFRSWAKQEGIKRSVVQFKIRGLVVWEWNMDAQDEQDGKARWGAPIRN